MDSKRHRISNRGKISAQEDELPGMRLCLRFDHCLNLLFAELLAGVFLAIGKDHHHYP